MANTISNMKMTNPLKTMVSKRRKRYTQDGFNLDLSYIQDNLIAMGFPAEKLEGVYRNHIDDVVKFLESKHKDHYKIYNLCSERSYDVNKFQQRVANYPFDDHNPPRIQDIRPFCDDVHSWLTADRRNVAAVHCKAGKGRTGVMVCCYMLHSRQFHSANEALSFYGQKRTTDRKGVTIPSQRRYVGYYATLVQENLDYHQVVLSIRSVCLEPVPALFSSGQGNIQLVITHKQEEGTNKYSTPLQEVKRGASSIVINLSEAIVVQGDVKLEFFYKPKMMMRKEKMFHFWFNTFFVRDHSLVPEPAENGNSDLIPDRSSRSLSYEEQPLPDTKHRAGSLSLDSADTRPLILRIGKWDLDDAHKDKTNKIYSPDFRVSLSMVSVPGETDATSWQPQQPQDTPSESSEAESSEGSSPEEDEEGWESGFGHRFEPDLYKG
ncbi:phosphatidylinositol 3,4,5-trisphosphate 3-phosphatase and dual-specificity protein phosphatase PTEN-like isoform X3 [Macrosteles quadrilineatus]|uniref:phosphatidylinositol 3,4,5-trisphosphate 3-phosphatase and dual-specificity protein phosphatase PTEN-like isoform X3 n=2 Tax=Macrosteles quadrilineatus TaxID=74068 RepID=UPI0023E1BA55|nr:phosphatidylinositol 3,4,5-trisphosphate 3-phosphatase and dual-specificity protein phosphatase PTEN-like isoform X3 [Macrosteles quadrilineatus]XP_054268318.1 phosphatidylinositol 3,4,5-trisphosphate 3-phosphatase and dual-specificity protein phosphatase PTEN-like isoform X3 [Macrosteles quadrilineatus]